ncbi:MAG TPA: transcriptional repressor [Candidatus Manganitrophaceae bacterium]|nr:transcriptional repressor [Candidatus Manganitrophaceae bacterium]
MKKHKDLLAVLRHNQQRITPARRFLLQFFIDNKAKQLPLPEIQAHLQDKLPGINRSSVYRNLEMLKRLSVIQELTAHGQGKRYQFVFERQVHHFIICKACGKISKGNRSLFEKVEKALKEIHDFQKANLSVTFYGFCSNCASA